jgi:hypothetical protein
MRGSLAVMAVVGLLFVLGCSSSPMGTTPDEGGGGSVQVVIPGNAPGSRYVPMSADTVEVEVATSVIGSAIGTASAPWDPVNGARVTIKNLSPGNRWFRGRARQGGASGTVLARGVVKAVVLAGRVTEVRLDLIWGDLLYASAASGNWEIYKVNADMTGTPVNLTNNTAADYEPSASALGNAIAFQSYRDGVPEIYRMNRDGSNQIRLTNNSIEDRMPSISPDFRTIAWTQWDGGSSVYRLALMNPDGTNQRVVAGLDASFGGPPLWSPDSGLLCVTAYTDGTYDYDATVVKADGTVVGALHEAGNQYPLDWDEQGNILYYDVPTGGYRSTSYPSLSGSCALCTPVTAGFPLTTWWLVRAPGGENLFVTDCDTGTGQHELYYLNPQSTTSPSTWDWPYTRLTASPESEMHPCFLPMNKADAAAQE